MHQELTIHPDAYFLTSHWAKMFQPWCWDFKQSKLRLVEQTQPFIDSQLGQVQFALNDGQTRDGLLRLLKEAKQHKRPIKHIFEAFIGGSSLPDASANLLATQAEVLHNTLYERNGQRKASFTLKDLVLYSAPIFHDTEGIRQAFRVIIARYGLDTTLYALDQLRTDGWKPNSPYALKVFLETASTARSTQLQQRHASRAEVTNLKDQPIYASTPDLDWTV